MRLLTERQKEIVVQLNDPLYTVQFLEHWLNRKDDITINAPAALQAMAAEGFFKAVLAMEKAPMDFGREEASELVRAFIKEEDANPCEWCKGSGDCDGCSRYEQDNAMECKFTF